MRKLFLMACVSFVLSVSADNRPLWMRNSVISPNGDEIAFTYKGNIYTVPINGGKAKQITSLSSSYDTHPIWSPDGSKIAFSSNRNGSFDVYLVSKEGGSVKKLTSHSANEIPEAFIDNGRLLFRAYIQPDANSQQFPSTMFTQIYEVDTVGNRPKVFSPLHMESLSVNGNKILYTDKKGYEDTWRKHHTSSVTRDIWLYDAKDKTHKKLSTFVGENRNGVWSSDGKTYYYLSEKDGTFNVYKANINSNGQDVQISNFKKHPVRFLSIDKNDNLCFSYDGELYVLKNGDSKPTKVPVEIITDDFEREQRPQRLNSGVRSIAVSPNGKEIAFIAHGNVFVTSMDYSTTKQITNTPEQERDVCFSPDGRSLVYSSERDNTWNIYKTELVRAEDKSFLNAKELKETKLTDTQTPSFQPIFSPDGKEIAYLENRSEIKVLNLKSNKSCTVMPGKFNYSYSDGDQWFQWSPDSKWILSDYIGVGGWNNKDVALIKADGSKDIVNLTQSGYNDVGAKWVLDGNAILFSSDRAGYRSHGSWGAERDVYLMFLNTEAYDDFLLNKEERELKKEEDKNKEEEKKKEEDKNKNSKKRSKKGDSDAKDDKKPEESKQGKELKFDLDGRQDRTLRLTRNSSNMSDAHLSKDGTKLYYLSSFEGGYDLWEQDILDKSTKIIAKNVGGGRLIPDKDNKNLYMASGGQIKKIDNGKVSNISFSVPYNYKKPQERNYIFNHIWKQVNDKFYDEKIHNVDWEMYKKEYEKFLPHINNNYDFQDMLSEMLGELNASHTGARYNAGADTWPTASLGVFWDNTYEGDGLKIQEIIAGGPLSKANSKFRPEIIIEKIDGTPIEKGKPYWQLLEGKNEGRILITAYDPKTKKRFEEEVKPISQGEENALLYKRWVKQREKLVDKYSNGRIGYIHIKGMDSQSFRDTYRDLLGKFRDKDAVVLDTRFNGGGWLHDDLVTLLSGKEYQQFKPRGQYIGSDPFNKWNKPSIVIVGEGNYSNAHGFPWVYKNLGIGKLVGAPVPGTMTAVWWETQVDPSLVFGVPQVTVVDMNGTPLENNQLQPDIEVYNTPESLLSSDDLQLKAAVDELLKEVKERKK